MFRVKNAIRVGIFINNVKKNVKNVSFLALPSEILSITDANVAENAKLASQMDARKKSAFQNAKNAAKEKDVLLKKRVKCSVLNAITGV